MYLSQAPSLDRKADCRNNFPQVRLGFETLVFQLLDAALVRKPTCCLGAKGLLQKEHIRTSVRPDTGTPSRLGWGAGPAAPCMQSHVAGDVLKHCLGTGLQ